MTITVCTHPQRCTAMEQAHSDMAAQLAAVTTERDRLRAALVQAQAEAREWQDVAEGAQKAAAFHLAGFEQECRKAVTA